ncbi:hypothetical protein SASPL_148541 [Salvia splendens]|uniref:Amino acid transporter transmembrane domain-containing protein n=1 Tax=Salvia splendens TaxID=180675 RepID=A0A8X8WB03_SALSN|nr:hypothetical protein SASPL_148541 [Salvia splendens]
MSCHFPHYLHISSHFPQREMSEMVENGAAAPPLEGSEISPAAAAPNPMQSQYNSPSLSMKPLLMLEHPKAKTPSRTPNFITPLGSPIRRAMKTTRLDPQDAWLPITESRKGNAFYAAFHTLFAGIRIQALVIPVAFTILGWSWGIISLTVAFVWQLYTFWLLTNLHESTETGMRYSRYLQLFDAIFGEKTGKIFAVFPILYLSDGTCVALIVVGGSAIKLFYQIVYGGSGCPKDPLTMVEWYLVFTSATVLVSQLPNLNSIAGVSLIGSLTAVGYCTMMWCVSVTEGRLPSVSYDHVKPNTNTEWFFGVLNAFGIIAFAFRGHSVTLESMSAILAAIYAFHGRDTSQSVLGLISLFVIINAVSSFQIYGMPMFDDVESKITKRLKRPLPWWLRVISRFMFGYGCFFVAVAIPFLGSLAGLIGGIAVPVMFVYPSLMWIKVKKPQRHGFMWCLNWGLAIAGILLTMLLVAAGIHVIIDTGVEVSFFKPH